MDPKFCTTCTTAVAGEDYRLLPADVGGTLVDGTFCEACWPAALATVRAALANADPDEFEDVMQAALVRAYFSGRDVRVVPADSLDRGGLVANALWLLDQIAARNGFWWRRVMCSGCHETPRELDVTTIPWWNDGASDYVTTYRCKPCVTAGLAETLARLAQDANEDASRICALFERHAVFVHEYRRGDPPDVVRAVVERLLAMIADGTLILPIGKTQPVA